MYLRLSAGVFTEYWWLDSSSSDQLNQSLSKWAVCKGVFSTFSKRLKPEAHADVPEQEQSEEQCGIQIWPSVLPAPWVRGAASSLAREDRRPTQNPMLNCTVSTSEWRSRPLQYIPLLFSLNRALENSQGLSPVSELGSVNMPFPEDHLAP